MKTDDLRRWKREGLAGPVVFLSQHEAVRIKGDIKEQRSRSGIAATRNRHMDLPVLNELCADPQFWQPVHDILGDELVLWRTNMLLNDPRLPWHEDRHSKVFVREALSFSVLLAIDDLPLDHCTVFVPGSHRLTIPEKESRYGITALHRPSGNLRYTGRVAAEFSEPMPLRAGEGVLFHPHLLHASASCARERHDVLRDRMILSFRISAAHELPRDEAFPDAREDRDAVLRFIGRSPRLARRHGRLSRRRPCDAPGGRNSLLARFVAAARRARGGR